MTLERGSLAKFDSDHENIKHKALKIPSTMIIYLRIIVGPCTTAALAQDSGKEEHPDE